MKRPPKSDLEAYEVYAKISPTTHVRCGVVVLDDDRRDALEEKRGAGPLRMAYLRDVYGDACFPNYGDNVVIFLEPINPT